MTQFGSAENIAALARCHESLMVTDAAVEISETVEQEISQMNEESQQCTKDEKQIQKDEAVSGTCGSAFRLLTSLIALWIVIGWNRKVTCQPFSIVVFLLAPAKLLMYMCFSVIVQLTFTKIVLH